MSADRPKHWLDCPDCSCRVFARVEDLEQLKYEADYTPPPSKVSDVARARIMATLEADCESCVLPGCVPAHTALEVLGAHDDAAHEVERLTETVTDGAKAVSAEQKLTDAALAKVERLTGELATLEVEVERLTEDETERVQDARHAMRLARVDRGVVEVEAARLRERVAVLEAKLAGGTPTGATPSMTGPEFIAAARKSGLFTAEAVEEIRADIARQRGATPPEPGGES